MAERGIIFKDDFVSVPSKSWFDMSYDHLFSMNFGELVPSTCMECMAEDVIHTKSTNFTRLAPLAAPAFGKVNQFSYHFYVRNRDIWTHWDSFFTNADQKKSWQSSLNTSFVAPVMPYLDIRRILYGNGLFNNFAGNLSDLILFEYSNGTISDTKTITFSGLGRDLHALIFWADSDGKYSSIVDHFNPILNNTRQMVVFFFIPNKDEYDAYHTIQRDGSPSPYFYNPFSNGSLFDYLGVDLTGMYKYQYGFYDNAITQMETLLGKDAVCDPFLDTFIPRAFEPNSSESVGYGVDVDINEFLSKHAVVGCFFNYSSTYSISVSSYNRYFMIKNSVDSYGDVTYSGGSPLKRTEETAKISALPLRAYHFIYSEYFRDENYIDVNKNVDFTRDGDDIDWSQDKLTIFEYLTLKNKAWEHDPYTTALPGPQRGQAVRFLSDAKVKVVKNDSNIMPSGTSYQSIAPSSNNLDFVPVGASATTTYDSSARNLIADLSAATIENFRFANATQRYLEKVARSGNRYYEYMKSIFGADIEDAKLNRPIYLQGDKTPIQISEVIQTSASQLSDNQPLGQMAGRAVAVGNDDYLEYVTPDNGFFIELCCIIPRVSYQQGLNPMFTRKVQLDYPIPDYAQLGEEQVNVSELYYRAEDSVDNQPFGFQSRYYQWKYNRDRVSGEFKDSLDYWTFARKFDSVPVAGKKFLEVDVDYRQFAVTSKNFEHVYTHMFHDIQVQRALPIFGVPSL